MTEAEIFERLDPITAMKWYRAAPEDRDAVLQSEAPAVWASLMASRDPNYAVDPERLRDMDPMSVTEYLGSSPEARDEMYRRQNPEKWGLQNAEDQYAQSTQDAIAAMERMYQQARTDIAPWRETGQRSLADLERVQGLYEQAVMDPSKYQESPEYQWLYEQGLKGLQRGAAMSGKLDSGQNLQDLVQYGQGMGLQGYQGYLGRLEGLMNRYAGTAGAGQTAASGLGQMGMQSAAQQGAYSQDLSRMRMDSALAQMNAQQSSNNLLTQGLWSLAGYAIGGPGGALVSGLFGGKK